MIDLHVHTTASDGRLRPAEVIDRAAAQGLAGLVFTDHSVVTFDGLADVAERAGIRLPFPGVEVSTFTGTRRHHVVVYGFGVLDPDFQSYLTHPTRWKNAAMESVRTMLVADGVPFPALDTVRDGSAPGLGPTPEKTYPSRTAMARCLAAITGTPVDEAYRTVVRLAALVDGRDAGDRDRLSRRYLPTLDVLDAAARVGAATVLAHPLWQCRTFADVEELVGQLPRFVEHGLRGVATRSYHHRALDDHPRLLAAARRLNLITVGGSDYHGNGKTELGADPTTPDGYQALIATIEERAAGRHG